jgi:hypothetical protein
VVHVSIEDWPALIVDGLAVSLALIEPLPSSS